ncbi:hypothetical protein [uncultured Ilyobacter sp.]|uniref:hypothetical protein n=1 Tax=uncultured Ilyobacter sp. TaxID=544433 RepID=UPI0029F5321B|nr:hypothetical protein [uncultured Ilyobacter sp.]
MKKLLMIGFVFISTLTFADSGSLSLNLGDGHRGGADVSVSLSVNDGYHQRYHEPRSKYIEKEVHVYNRPRYVKKVVHKYEKPRYVKKVVHKYEKPRYSKKYKNRSREPQKVVVINNYHRSHNKFPHGQAKKYERNKKYRNRDWKN